MFFQLLYYLLFSIGCVAIVLLVSIVYLRLKYKKRTKNPTKTVAFFHPYCNSGGGGERVLWSAIQTLIQRYKNIEIYVYTTQTQYGASEILESVERSFKIKIDFKNIDFVYLTRQKWIQAETYPFMTLLGQSLGSIWLALEAFKALQPDVLIDTMGCPFAMIIFKLLGNCKIGCYVHYPIITSEMMRRVQRRVSAYNNKQFIARSPIATTIKLIYYRIFGFLYYLVGKCPDIIMVNSTWTEGHINELWNRPFFTICIYPPCPTEHLKELKRTPLPLPPPATIRILSVGQFRPEKNHFLQIQSLFQLRSMIVPHGSVDDDVYDRQWKSIKLILIGSCRNDDDINRVQDLKDCVRHLALDDSVEFKINISYDELLEEYSRAVIGLHTMQDEHFGIGVVEMLAAGLITIAHCSGGPLLDIIDTSMENGTGLLASDSDQYASALLKIIENLHTDEVLQIARKGRDSVDRFSINAFQVKFNATVQILLID